MTHHYVNYRASETKLFLVDIPNGDHESVKKFLAKYPTRKTLYNDNKESVAAIALKFGQIEIYDTLLARGFSLGISEDIDAITQHLDCATKEKLREINKKYLIDPKWDHLTSLLSKCKLSHDALESEHKKIFSFIAKILIDLNEIEEIEPILKVVSCSDDLKVIFDFYQNSVQHMVPAASKNTNGICFQDEGSIYVAAESFVSNPRNLLGVIAHEMCHYAMNLVYENDCNPYKMKSEMTAKFEDILVTCEAKKELEPCIGIVFDEQNYPDTSDRPAELIARVPQLTAMYKDTERLEDLKQEFRELFEFYEVEVLNDLERHYKLMLSSNLIKEINDLSGLSRTLKSSKLQLKSGEMNVEHDESRISMISSNCVELTMVAIYNKHYSDENFDSKCIFLKADALLNDKMFDLALKAFSAPSKPVIIIDGGTIKPENVFEIIMKLQANQINQRCLLVIRDDSPIHRLEFNVTKLEVTHRWSQLSRSAKGKLIPLEDSIRNENLLHEISLRDLFEGKIAIGSALKFDEIDFYLPRRFRLDGKGSHLCSVQLEQHTISEYEFGKKQILNILYILNGQQLILLSENPGMGKSTEFKMISLRIKEEFPSDWVVFVDLKAFVSQYQKDGKVTQKFENQEQITRYFCDEILKIKGFEAEVFKLLFWMNQVVFLLDGFDEISPSFKEFILTLIMAITNESENQLWISTRPHLEKEFTDFFRNALLENMETTVNLLRLEPFTRIEKEEFLRRKLKFKITEEGLVEEKLRELMQVIDKLEQHKTDSSPLLLQLVDDFNFLSPKRISTQSTKASYKKL